MLCVFIQLREREKEAHGLGGAGRAGEAGGRGGKAQKDKPGGWARSRSPPRGAAGRAPHRPRREKGCGGLLPVACYPVVPVAHHHGQRSGPWMRRGRAARSREKWQVPAAPAPPHRAGAYLAGRPGPPRRRRPLPAPSRPGPRRARLRLGRGRGRGGAERGAGMRGGVGGTGAPPGAPPGLGERDAGASRASRPFPMGCTRGSGPRNWPRGSGVFVCGGQKPLHSGSTKPAPGAGAGAWRPGCS